MLYLSLSLWSDQAFTTNQIADKQGKACELFNKESTGYSHECRDNYKLKISGIVCHKPKNTLPQSNGTNYLHKQMNHQVDKWYSYQIK